MQDKPDGGGCLSATDEEREPCLKTSADLSPKTDKKNGTLAAPPPSTDNNNGTSNGKFYAFVAATSLEQKLRDKTGFSRTGLAVAVAAVLLCLVLFVTLVVLIFMWPSPPRHFPVCRRAACLRASAEVSF